MRLKYMVFFLLCLFCLSINLHAQPYPARVKMNFDSGWRFAFGSANEPKKDFNYSISTIFAKSASAPNTAIDPHFNDGNWRKLQLPHDWAVELPFIKSPSFDVMAHGYKPVGGSFSGNSIGWYRKHFIVPAADSGRRFEIQFDGIFRNASIWLNGFYVGNNFSGYVGCAYDVTDFISYTHENVLVVRVDATQYEGWFYEGAGIYRHVWLNEYNDVHIAHDGVFAYSNVAGNNATVSVETTVQNQSPMPSTCSVTAYLADRDGKVQARSEPQDISLPVNGEAPVKQSLMVADPKLWSVDTPYLYRIIAVVSINGKVVDSCKMRFGIRTVNIRADGLFVNGKYIKVHGTNNHQDAAGVGSALPDYLQYYRVGLLKEMGVNACRTSHNAPTPEFLDACDSLGILVLDEQRLLTSSPEYLGQFERLVKRDRSRACVFLWSIGNEEGWIQTNSFGKRIAQTFIAKQKELDPTRTCTYAADVANEYEGVNQVIPVRGFNYRILGVDPYHKDHPQQPIIGTEMGSTVTTRGIYTKDTINCYVPDEDITAPWWANTAEQWWSLAATRPWWMGGFIWTGFDYRGEPTPYEWPNISSHFGVMDVCGFPKNIYYYYQSWWTDKDVLHIFPHWNWKGKEGQPIDVWVNSNADNIELFLNGKSLGKKDMPRNSHLQWSVPYKPGTLEAVAYKNGRKFTSKVETTGAPAKIVITPAKTTMVADGRDADVLNITVVDAKGLEVPDAQNLVHFSINGGAAIIGVGNGDPSSHEQDKYNDTAAQRHLFNGKCQLIIQAGRTKGTAHLEVKADGLEGGVVDIKLQ